MFTEATKRRPMDDDC